MTSAALPEHSFYPPPPELVFKSSRKSISKKGQEVSMWSKEHSKNILEPSELVTKPKKKKMKLRRRRKTCAFCQVGNFFKFGLLDQQKPSNLTLSPRPTKGIFFPPQNESRVGSLI